MFLKECWYVIAWEHDVPPHGTALGRQVIDEPIVIYRDRLGAIHALQDRCPHRHAALSLGRVDGETIQCMYHGMTFGPDGRCLKIPGMDAIPVNSSVKSFPVALCHGWVWIWMGEPSRADSSLIPSAWGVSNPLWRMRSGKMEFAAKYELIHDNLCDFNHIDFVHETTIGTIIGNAKFTDRPGRVVQRERAVQVQRWFENVVSPGGSERVDFWQSYEFSVPGIFVMESLCFPLGTAARANFRNPSVEDALFHEVEQQAVTPITEKRSSYFYASGFRAVDCQEAVLEQNFALLNTAFEEDRRMIEGQQRIWDQTRDGTPMLFLPSDKGLSMMRRLMKRMERAEQARPATQMAADETSSVATGDHLSRQLAE